MDREVIRSYCCPPLPRSGAWAPQPARRPRTVPAAPPPESWRGDPHGPGSRPRLPAPTAELVGHQRDRRGAGRERTLKGPRGVHQHHTRPSPRALPVPPPRPAGGAGEEEQKPVFWGDPRPHLSDYRDVGHAQARGMLPRLVSFSVSSSSFIPVVACHGTYPPPRPVKAEYCCSMASVHPTWGVRSPAGGHAGRFCLLATENNAVMDLGVQVSAQVPASTPLGSAPRSGIP